MSDDTPQKPEWLAGLLKGSGKDRLSIGVGDIMPHCKAITNVTVGSTGMVMARLPDHVFNTIHDPIEITDIQRSGLMLANGDDMLRLNRGTPDGKGLAIWVDRAVYDADRTDLPAHVHASQQVNAMAASLSEHFGIPIHGSVFEHPLIDNDENPTPIALVLTTTPEHAKALETGGVVAKELQRQFSTLRGKWHRENPDHINDDRQIRRTDLDDDTPGNGGRGR